MKTSEYFGVSEKMLSAPCEGWANFEECLLYNNDEFSIHMVKTLPQAAKRASKAIEAWAHDIQVLERVTCNGYAVIVR